MLKSINQPNDNMLTNNYQSEISHSHSINNQILPITYDQHAKPFNFLNYLHEIQSLITFKQTTYRPFV